MQMTTANHSLCRPWVAAANVGYFLLVLLLAGCIDPRMAEFYRLNGVKSDYPVGQVRILGCVKRPGAFLWQPNMTLGDILTMAGGTTDCARRIALYRDPAESIIPSRVFPLPEVGSSVWAEVLRIGDTLWVEKSDRLEPQEHQR